MTYQEVKVRKADTLKEVMHNLAAQMNFPVGLLRIWPMNHRTNHTLRPSLVDMEADQDKTIQEVRL